MAKKRTRPSAASRKEYEKGRRIRKRFNDAIAKLPRLATAARELNWIRNHPAMGRRPKSEGGKIEITVADFDGAPSQAAVNQLYHWVDKPDEFWKQLMQESKKSLKEIEVLPGEDNDDELPPDIKNIDEMLQAIEGALPVQ